MTLPGRLAETVARLLALVGSIGVVLMMLHVGADILARNLFGRPLPATNEIVSRYYMVFIAFLPLAWVERRRGMVAVDLVSALGPRAMRLSDLFVALLATAIYGVLAYVTWFDAVAAFRSGRSVIALNLLIPVWPTFFLPPVGFGLAAAVTLVRAFETVAGVPPARDGDPWE